MGYGDSFDTSNVKDSTPVIGSSSDNIFVGKKKKKRDPSIDEAIQRRLNSTVPTTDAKNKQQQDIVNSRKTMGF